MKATLRFLKTTLAGGLLFLMPFIILIVILEKALGLAQRIVVPLAAQIPVKSLIGLETPKLLALALVVLFCALAGLFARTTIARWLVNRLETEVLANLPGYEFIKAMFASTVGVDPEQAQEVVLARIEDAWQVAFLIERLEPDHVAVFIPGAPNPQSGAVYFMTTDRIKPTNLPPARVLKCLRRVGVGANQMLTGLLADDLPKPRP
jgi:uncharacterized membrane protein